MYLLSFAIEIDLIRIEVLFEESWNIKKKQWFVIQRCKVNPYNLPTYLQIKGDLLSSQLIKEKVKFLWTFKQIAIRELNLLILSCYKFRPNAFFFSYNLKLSFILWNRFIEYIYLELKKKKIYFLLLLICSWRSKQSNITPLYVFGDKKFQNKFNLDYERMEE